jgi:hypothetical protein
MAIENEGKIFWTSCDIEGPATLDNLEIFLQDLEHYLKVDGEGWEHLRRSVRQYCLEKLNESDNDITRLLDISCKVGPFYQGYMICNEEWATKVQALIDQSKASKKEAKK